MESAHWLGRTIEDIRIWLGAEEVPYTREPIIPGVGVAGVEIGDSDKSVVKKLGGCYMSKHYRCTSRVSYSSVDIWFDDKKVIAIIVYGGYEGKTKEGVGIGTKLSKVRTKFGQELRFSEGLWEFSPDSLGIRFLTIIEESDEVVSEIDIVSGVERGDVHKQSKYLTNSGL